MRESTDQDLIERARAGDEQALEMLLERYQAQIYRFGMKMCRDPEVAKDVVQETLLAMARNLRDFQGTSSLSTWLYSIARSFCIKKRRKSKYAPEERSLDTEVTSEAQRLADPALGADEALAGKRLEKALEDAIDALEPTYREVLVLRDVAGLTAPEVAEVLGVSVQAVKSRLHRARLTVRSDLAPLLEIPTVAEPASAGKCPDVLTLFSQHLEDEVSAETCAEMEEHLRTCGRCQGACDSLKRTLALCKTAGSTAQVPASVQKSVKVALRGFLAENS